MINLISFIPMPGDISLFSFNIPVWGAFAVLSMATFAVLYSGEIERPGLRKRHAFAVALHFCFWTFLGIHLYRLIFVLHSTSIMDYISYNSRGIDSFGIVFGLAFALAYLKYRRERPGGYMDALAVPCLAAATVWRAGCMLVADEKGIPAILPWSIFQDNALRHPIGAYYFIVSLGILLLLVYLSSRAKELHLMPGSLMLYGFILYSGTRVILDFYREDPVHAYLGLSVHQVAYLLLFAVLVSIPMFARIKTFLEPAMKGQGKQP